MDQILLFQLSLHLLVVEAEAELLMGLLVVLVVALQVLQY
jgi:hypothetical protein